MRVLGLLLDICPSIDVGEFSYDAMASQTPKRLKAKLCQMSSPEAFAYNWSIHLQSGFQGSQGVKQVKLDR